MLTSQKLELIRKDMKTALSMVEATHNLQFNIGKITYSSHTFRVSLEAAIGKNGEEADLARTKWDKECYGFGLTRADFGKRFKSHSGKMLTIIDIRPRATKRPIVVVDDEGNEFITRVEQVKTALNKLAEIDGGTNK